MANGLLDPSTPAANANSVFEFRASSAPSLSLAHTYAVENPLGVAVFGPTAWALSASLVGEKPALYRLAHGIQVRSVRLAGSVAQAVIGSSALSACNGNLVVALTGASSPNTTAIEERSAISGALMQRWSVPVGGVVALACGSGGKGRAPLFAGVSSSNGGIFSLRPGGGVQRLAKGPSRFLGIAASGSRVWLAVQTSPEATALLDYRNGQLQGAIALPSSNAGPVAISNGFVWVAAGNTLIQVGR